LAKAGLPAIEPLARWRDAAQHRAARRPIPGTLLDRPRDPLSPRVHHWEIAHRLADEAEADPAAFWSLHAAPDGGQRLTELWEAHGATLPADHRLASAGLSREVLALPVTGGRSPLEILLITFPPPIGRDEMAYLAVGRDTTANVVYRYGNTPLRHAGEAGTEIVFKRGGITTHAGFGQPITRQRFLEYIEEDFAKATPG